jgi:CHRD domain
MQVNLTRSALAATALSAFLFAGVPAFAETVHYTADLSAKSEVPPTDSKGTGMVDATYDTTSKMLSWTVTYRDLSGPATAAHFHGPAAVGANAPPIVPVSGALTSPIKGTATLTAAQATDLEGGKVYFNIHTAAHKDGEIRGQLMKK